MKKGIIEDGLIMQNKMVLENKHFQMEILLKESIVMIFLMAREYTGGKMEAFSKENLLMV